VIAIESITENILAAVPPKLTAVAPVKCVPNMVTVPPLPADVGAKDVTVGAFGESYINPANIAVPPGVVTDTTPVDPAATVAVISLAETTVYADAAVPPKDTADAFVKFVPVMVTMVPVAAFVGVKAVMVGVGI
jgi:hypothetical protein